MSESQEYKRNGQTATTGMVAKKELHSRHVGLQTVYTILCDQVIETCTQLMFFDLMVDDEEPDEALPDVHIPLMLLATRRYEIRQVQDSVRRLLLAQWPKTSADVDQILKKIGGLNPALKSDDRLSMELRKLGDPAERHFSYQLKEDLLHGFIGERLEFGAVRVRSNRRLGVLREVADRYHFHTPIEKNRRYGHYFKRCTQFFENSAKTAEVSHTGWHQGFATALDVRQGICTRIWKRDENRFLIVHCPGRFLLRIEDHLAILYPQIARQVNPNDFEEVCACVGLLHWFLVQGTFYKRGSASIAELFALSLFRAIHLRCLMELSEGAAKDPTWNPPVRFVSGVMPDLEAFFLPKQEYVRRYHTFFVWRTTVSVPPEKAYKPWLTKLIDLPLAPYKPLEASKPASKQVDLLCHTFPPCGHDVQLIPPSFFECWQDVHKQVEAFPIS